MRSETRTVPAFDQSDGSRPYGIAAEWQPALTDIDTQTPAIRPLKLTAHGLKLLLEIPNELLGDAAGLNAAFENAMRAAGAYHLDVAFLSGTGAGQPLGIHNAPCTIAVDAEVGQGVSVVFENIKRMYGRLHPASVKNAIWLAHTSCIPDLLSLSQVIGTGGSAVPVLRESNGQFSLLGRPLFVTDRVPALGARADVGLYDMSAYTVGLRLDMTIDASAHLGFKKYSTFLRLVVRADGQPSWDVPQTPANGTDTLSPFVVLGART